MYGRNLYDIDTYLIGTRLIRSKSRLSLLLTLSPSLLTFLALNALLFTLHHSTNASGVCNRPRFISSSYLLMYTQPTLSSPSLTPHLSLPLFQFFIIFFISSSSIVMFTARAGEIQLQCASKPLMMDKRWKTGTEIAPNCPRCASPNTKFCYYNNYSLSQPRYFCKGCRRYWTKGGSLRNVPIGGGCRKNRRFKSISRTQQPTDSVSLTFCRSSNGNPSAIPSLTSTSNTGNAPNIDLAAVFAKFFNQNQNSCFDNGLLPSENQVVMDMDSLSNLTASSGLPSHDSLPIQFPEEQVQAQQQQQDQEQGKLTIGCDDLEVLFVEDYEFGLKDQTIRIPQFMEYPYPNGYGIQSMLNNEISQATENFSWQTVEGLESEIPSADHYLTFYPNVLLNEDCESFDLSSYGISSSRTF
ncbi:hypothetical protein NE237_028449 [Protea cynaroides]|uniref:Dof zinc finger protein n=1 Tax=Protea cynaroides TaxID=273540 RepID=A0A9Q0JU25_9MAGN|nr:hypothetical protein NE237_028449 [Protea cynaroides]